MSGQLPDCARTNDIGVPSVSSGNGASNLRLIHRLRGGETAKVPQINDGDSDDGQGHENALDPDGQCARFQCVHRTLNEVCATRHFVLVQPRRFGRKIGLRLFR